MPTLTPVAQKFILHWGEMGTRWGINRTVAQVHALLFIAPKPLNAEDITKTLSVARSNVSTSLRELQGWGIVRVFHRAPRRLRAHRADWQDGKETKMRHTGLRVAALALAGLSWLAFALPGFAQIQARAEEIPLRQCDRLPVVTVRIDKADMSFLVDTAATSLLNLKSFASGRLREIQISSWTGTTATSAREVSVPELTLGNRKLRNLKLPAVDLTPIATACGGPIDGILGVDLLEQLGLTIDLQRRVARFATPPDPAEASLISEMEAAMHDCSEAFNNADKEKLASCFDRDLVLNTPWGEYRGRDKAAEYLHQRFFTLTPRVRLSMKIHDQRAVGEVVWTSYDYFMDSRDIHLAGRGMMLCRKQENRWYILSIHDSLNAADSPQKP